MVIQHIRWQALIALSGILLLLTMLGYLSNTVQTVMLPEQGGSYVEGISSHPGNLNPLYLQTRADHDLAGLLFHRLTRATESGMIEAELATSWDISDNRGRYTFHLREDVLWHDGAPFTAADVAFTIRVIQDPAYEGDPAAADLWRNVEVEVVNPHTIRFTLPTSLIPFAPFLS
ncbi:MAG: peptide ABC transporter substrate-binding protein, partial [Ardenticatenales bacterium]|nr:peptide ABC transporter substrate-binding protein [Ardenticatenales bacterium]